MQGNFFPSQSSLSCAPYKLSHKVLTFKSCSIARGTRGAGRDETWAGRGEGCYHSLQIIKSSHSCGWYNAFDKASNLDGAYVILASTQCVWVDARRRTLGCCIQALLEELEAGQEKLIKAQKHADTCQAKICALEDK